MSAIPLMGTLRGQNVKSPINSLLGGVGAPQCNMRSHRDSETAGSSGPVSLSDKSRVERYTTVGSVITLASGGSCNKHAGEGRKRQSQLKSC